MTAAKPQGMSEKRLEDAAAWHVRLNTGDADEALWIGFTEWLEADSANREAFAQVEDLHADLDAVAETLRPRMSELESASNIVALAPARRTAWPSRTIVSAGIALLAATLLIFAGVRQFNRDTAQPRLTEYATAIGKTQTVSLADGSTIDLNTGTKVAVAIGGPERRVRFDQGEAFFRVAKDSTHPFVVAVGDIDVRVVGTEFNVLRNAGSVVVTVAEGKVSVSPHGAGQSNPLAQLLPRDQLVHREGDKTVTVRQTDPAAVLGWRNGYLSYENAPLSQVVSDLNRYFPDRIVLQDDALASRPFSGVLRVDNEDAVLGRLGQFLSLEAKRTADRTITLSSKPGSK